jgi:hypothetical protein
MSAYVIVEIDIVDPAGYEEYKKLAGATVEKYGGKYIVRSGKRKCLKAIGNPSASSCFNSTRCNAQKIGSTARSTANRAKCAIAPPGQT